MKKIIAVLIYLLLYAFSSPAQQTASDSCFSGLLAVPGLCGQRNMGDLQILYQVDSTGADITCILLLNTQLAGGCRLTANSNAYDFDLELGSGKTKGSLTLMPAAPCSISSLNGNFIYTVTGNNTNFTFKGSVVIWYTRCVSIPQQFPITFKR